MKFIVTYFFTDNEEDGAQVDIVKYKDKKSCISAYNTDEYENVEIKEYNENAILEEMYSDEDDEYNEEDDEYNEEENSSILFPNADTKEELEEELEHLFTRMMDN
ncbi:MULTISPECIES: hypothetical protein [Clostridium]|uniref:hypothetical protein n=1 Tax=Clostridium TaxID=1485 RepID=UPI0013FF0A81|nr:MULTISPECIES: hypothetical protein [Clostridium]MBY6915762.1 hypothetical protein [Clostridium botulinum]NFI53315.1 hypothetical protein [Clostridium botulinum]NFO39228.1 hypothetical protein [Clostridium botulinum]NFQ40152.1 hypothetical protein [Clostridium botulinum]